MYELHSSRSCLFKYGQNDGSFIKVFMNEIFSHNIIIEFEKCFTNLKGAKHSLHACKCSFSYFSLLYDANTNKHSLYSMTSVVVLFDYSIAIMSNIDLDKKRSYKNSTKYFILVFYMIFRIHPTKFCFMRDLLETTDLDEYDNKVLKNYCFIDVKVGKL